MFLLYFGQINTALVNIKKTLKHWPKTLQAVTSVEHFQLHLVQTFIFLLIYFNCIRLRYFYPLYMRLYIVFCSGFKCRLLIELPGEMFAISDPISRQVVPIK